MRVNIARNADEAAGRLDRMVEPAREPENDVSVDNARVVRWAGPAFVLFSLILLPLDRVATAAAAAATLPGVGEPVVGFGRQHDLLGVADHHAKACTLAWS